MKLFFLLFFVFCVFAQEANIKSPMDGSTIYQTNQEFIIDGNYNYFTNYDLVVGTQPFQKDIAVVSISMDIVAGNNTQILSVDNLPGDGSTIYVTFYFYSDNYCGFNTYEYRSVDISDQILAWNEHVLLIESAPVIFDFDIGDGAQGNIWPPYCWIFNPFPVTTFRICCGHTGYYNLTLEGLQDLNMHIAIFTDTDFTLYCGWNSQSYYQNNLFLEEGRVYEVRLSAIRETQIGVLSINFLFD